LASTYVSSFPPPLFSLFFWRGSCQTRPRRNRGEVFSQGQTVIFLKTHSVLSIFFLFFFLFPSSLRCRCGNSQRRVGFKATSRHSASCSPLFFFSLFPFFFFLLVVGAQNVKGPVAFSDLRASTTDGQAPDLSSFPFLFFPLARKP